MELKDFEKLAEGRENGLIPMRMTSDDFLPYATGEIAGFPAGQAFRNYSAGHAVLLEGGDSVEAAPKLNRALAGEGVAGTTLLTEEAVRALSAKELDELTASGNHPLHAAANARAVLDGSGRSGTDQSFVGVTSAALRGPLPAGDQGASTQASGSTGEQAVDIPENWKGMHHLQRVKLAAAISGGKVETAHDADQIIAAEAERREAGE